MEPTNLVVEKIEVFSSKMRLVHFKSGEEIPIDGWIEEDPKSPGRDLRFMSRVNGIDSELWSRDGAKRLKTCLYPRLEVPKEKFDDPKILLKARSVIAGAILDHCKSIENTIDTIGFYDYDIKNTVDENGVSLRLSPDSEKYKQLAEESSETDINDLILEVQQLLAKKMRELGMVENAQNVTDNKARCDAHVDKVDLNGMTTSGSSEGAGESHAVPDAGQADVANVL